MQEVSVDPLVTPLNKATVLYNAACTFASMGKKAEAIDALRKAWDAGYRDADWTRKDLDLASLHGDPEFERLYPAKAEEGVGDGRGNPHPSPLPSPGEGVLLVPLAPVFGGEGQGEGASSRAVMPSDPMSTRSPHVPPTRH
jgi:hypothetical protein